MVPLKKVRKETSRPSDRTLRTLTLTSIPGSRDPIVKPSHSCKQTPHFSAPQSEACSLTPGLQSYSTTCSHC